MEKGEARMSHVILHQNWQDEYVLMVFSVHMSVYVYIYFLLLIIERV